MKKKILIFHYSKSYGGGDIYLENLLPDLAKQFDLVLATVFPEQILSKLRDKNVTIPAYQVPLKDPFALFGVFAFWKILKKEKIDLIFTQDIGLSLFARIFQIFRRKLKHVTVIHANLRCFNYKLPLLKSFISFFNRISQKMISKYVCVSEYLVGSLVEDGVDRSLVELIHNAAPVCEALPARSAAKTRIGFIGRLSPEKGIDYYLEIAKRFSGQEDKIEFHVFGDGPMSGLVKSAKQVVFHGFVSDPFKKNDLDLVIMPSRDEGLPYTALECMACGIPLVVSSAGGLKDLIQNGQNGLLCPVGDIDAFVRALERLISENDLRHRLVLQAKESVRTKYSAEIMKERYIRLFNSLLTA